mmetsp:Transcript_66000/g.143830  ORF Transcript_66000/g.143830 Transcript_66000/m.143830 type:complete len:707 (-) Transcript_66000:127-2247(-)
MLLRRRSEGLHERSQPLSNCGLGRDWALGGYNFGSQGLSINRLSRRRFSAPERPESEEHEASPVAAEATEGGATSSTGGEGRALGSTSGPAQSDPGNFNCGSSSIIIHVRDDARHVRRDFACDRATLLAHMRYFEEALGDGSNGEEVDISVHCDVAVFAWLVEYMKDPQKAESLKVDTVVSILISAEFLRMEKLVETCLLFMASAIDQVVRLPLDLGCLSNDVVRQLASHLGDQELDEVRDRKDRLVSRLFAHKLESLLGDPENALHLCVYCSRLFTDRQREFMVCPKAKIFIDFHGNVIAQHVANKDWDVSSYVRHCHEELQLQWRDIYWRIWGRLQLMKCDACHRYFCGAELEHCCYHPERPVWREAPHAHSGVYPCCQQPAQRFGALVEASGCRAREHKVCAEIADGASLETLQQHRALICVPFEDREVKLAAAQEPKSQGANRDEDEDDLEDREEPWDGSTATAEAKEARDASGSGAGDASSPTCCSAGWTESGSCRYCYDPPPEHCRTQQDGWPCLAHGIRRTVSGSRRISARSQAKLVERRSGCSDEPRIPSQEMPRGGGCDPWPRPLADGAPSFFDSDFLRGRGAGGRVRPSRMDLLREDDRRRMDSLGEDLRRLREVRGAAGAGAGARGRGRGSSSAQKRGNLAWLGDAAASGPRPSSQRRSRAATPSGATGQQRQRQSGGDRAASRNRAVAMPPRLP